MPNARSLSPARTPRFVSLTALLAFAGLAMGCARGPDLVVNGLALRRAVIYRNGVGYFEREGRVDAEQVTFKVRNEKVGDFLATLAVIEQGGSSVRSASFPVAVDKVRCKGDEDETTEESDDDEPAPRRATKKHKKKPCDASEKLETVKLSLDGKRHDLIVGYVAETPVWRPSYRLVINGEGDVGKTKDTADLQAWGIVQNLSGEDWHDVRLSLVAGAPLAFQATLEKPVIPQRPVVSDAGEVISSVPVGETSLASELSPPPPPPPAPPAAEPEAQGETLDGLLAEKDEAESPAPSQPKGRMMGGRGVARKTLANAPGSGGGAMPKADRMQKPMASPMMAPAPMPMHNPSGPRNVNALAAIAMEEGTTHYDLPYPVDVPNDSATMVLLTARPVPGGSIFLFAPDGGVPQSSSHPFRVARFTNDTKGLLERGPIAVFEHGAFLGQGMVDPLPPGATATVPFALERTLGVESARSADQEGARVALIEGGRLEIERDWVTHTKYTVKNGSEVDAKMLVKHPRQYGTRLNDAPKGTEDNVGSGSALVPVDVPKRGSAVLDVDERSTLRRSLDWLDPLADVAVKAYMADPRADAVVVAALRQAWDARAKLRSSLDQRDALQAEHRALDAQVNQLNTSLRAIEKNKLATELRKDLTERLARASARIDEITKRVIVIEMQVSEQSIRFRDLVSAIKLTKPLPLP